MTEQTPEPKPQESVAPPAAAVPAIFPRDHFHTASQEEYDAALADLGIRDPGASYKRWSERMAANKTEASDLYTKVLGNRNRGGNQ